MNELHQATRSMSHDQWSAVQKIGQRCSLAEFEDFMINGELPMVELSPEELEAVGGGRRKPKVVTDPHKWPT
ncbi:MAG: hypothetical protein RL846_07695 [Deltaproteobacteria bacterium]